MSSETTKRHIRVIEGGIDGYWDLSGDGKATNLTGGSDPGAHLASLCQAKLALLQCLEIQERMEREQCAKCSGRGSFGEGLSLVECYSCNGTGRIQLDTSEPSEAETVAALGVFGADGSAGGGE
jgi:hypothetical protein